MATRAVHATMTAAWEGGAREMEAVAAREGGARAMEAEETLAMAEAEKARAEAAERRVAEEVVTAAQVGLAGGKLRSEGYWQGDPCTRAYQSQTRPCACLDANGPLAALPAQVTVEGLAAVTRTMAIAEEEAGLAEARQRVRGVQTERQTSQLSRRPPQPNRYRGKC